MKKLPIALLLALGVSNFSYAAEPLDSQIAAFKKAATEAYAKLPFDERRGRIRGVEDIALMIDQATAETTSDRDSLSALTVIVSTLKDNPEIASAGQELIKTIREQRVIARAKAREELDAAIAKAGADCLAATRVEDIDPIIAALLPYSKNNGGGRYDNDNAQRGQNAYRFVIRWQDYLDAIRDGRTSEAQNILRDLSSSVDVTMMPRSKLLALMPATPSSQGNSDDSNASQRNAEANRVLVTAAIPKLEQARTIDDLIAVVRSLTTRRDSYNNFSTTPLTNTLSGLIEERQQVIAGIRGVQLYNDSSRQLPVTDSAYTPAVQASLSNFRRETQLIAIRKNFADVKLPAVNDDETPDTYALRLVDKFTEDRDWLRVRDALDVYRSFLPSGRTPAWVSSDSDAIATYIAARNLDTAGQYAAAVVTYQRALRTAGKHLPIAAISERLAELKKTQPEAFSATGNEPADESGANTRVLRELPPGMMPNTPYSTGPSLPRLPAPTGPMKTPAASSSN